MHLLLLALVLMVLLHDHDPAPLGAGALAVSWPALLALVLGPKLALATGYFALCRWTLSRLARPRPAVAVQRHERLTDLFRLTAVALFGVDLLLGALLGVRAVVGNLILIDELLVMAPTLALLVFAWWAYYPIERRIREANLIGRLDAGGPVYAPWTRGQYVLAQVRHQMTLVLAPALLLLGWMETVTRFAPAHAAGIDADPRPLLIVTGAAVVFLLAPLMIRHLWDTVPLPEGEMRERLLAMCRRHRVGVRELLLWRTFGGVINAAVMGLLAPLRYILLTDALLEMVRREQVEAVMAHELAHVRKHHMFWLLVAAMGSLGALELGFGALVTGAQAALLPPTEPGGVARAGVLGPIPLDWLTSPHAAVVGTLLLTAATWIALFGWVSRRIERQADAFAAHHLATQREAPLHDATGRIVIDPESAQTMIDALQQVAELNHIPTHKRSWRHGSIAWRQRNLRDLVGQPAEAMTIDRTMRRIKAAAIVTLLLVVAAHTALHHAVPPASLGL